jgi:hypothetical protein
VQSAVYIHRECASAQLSKYRRLKYLKQGGWESGANPYETRRLGGQGLSLVIEPRAVL